MDLATAHHYFHSDYTVVGVGRIKAQLLAAPMEESAVYFLLPRRILKVDADSPVRPGDAIISGASQHMYLVGENGASEFQGRTIYKSLKLFEVTHRAASWKRDVKTTDAITGQKVKASATELGPIPVTIEFVKLQEDEMRISADLVRIISNKDIRVGDKVSDYVVTNVELQLGLRFCTAKRQ